MPTAAEQLAKLPPVVQERIKSKLDFYIHQKDPLHFAKRLTGLEAYRYRIGDYRVLFEADSKVVYVLACILLMAAFLVLLWI